MTRLGPERTLVAGVRRGNRKILERLPGNRVRVRCARCGSVRVVTISSLSHNPDGCMECRWRRCVEVMPCTGCGRPLRRPANTRLPVCKPCQRKRARGRERERNRRIVTGTLGRTCVCCGRDDSQCRWSLRDGLCGACSRMGERNGWAACGAPVRANGRCKAHPEGCRV